MPNYRRIFVPGGDYFFTVNLLDRQQTLLIDRIDLLRSAYGYVQSHHPFETVAICILPEHLHCIWRLPPEDAAYSMRWRVLKSRFSKSLSRVADTRPGRRKGERGIRQRRFWEHAIRDGDDLDRKRPVKPPLRTRAHDNYRYRAQAQRVNGGGRTSRRRGVSGDRRLARAGSSAPYFHTNYGRR